MSFFLSGPVVNGNKIGRTIGFPTANIKIDPHTDLRNGVYTAHLSVEGKRYAAMVNLGYKPTLGGEACRVLEAHILDFEGDLYGKTVEIELETFLREEVRFDSIEELREQIEKDKKATLALLSKYK